MDFTLITGVSSGIGDALVAVAHTENWASRRIMEKLGMHYEKTEFHYDAECAFYAISKQSFQGGVNASKKYFIFDCAGIRLYRTRFGTEQSAREPMGTVRDEQDPLLRHRRSKEKEGAGVHTWRGR
jgi:hypothetical protein